MIEETLKKNLQASYDRSAVEREKSTLQQWKVEERQHFLSLLQKEQKKTLLEIGAGTGKDGKFFNDLGFQTTSIDISPEMVRLCREKGLTAYVMGFDDLRFPINHFDAVWALNCLLHVPKKDLRDVLTGIRDVLRPSGLFYMGVYGGPNFEGVWEGDSYEPKRFFSFYDDEKIKAVVSNVFQIVSFKSIPAHAIGRGEHDFQSIILRKRGIDEDVY